VIDILLDLLIFNVDRLTFCSVDELKVLVNLLVEILLTLTQLLNVCILS